MNLKHCFSIYKFGPIRKFTPAAFLIGGLSLIASILGMLRDRTLASFFGAGDVLDMYYAAFRFPDLVFNILIFGALSSAFLPIFSEYVSRDKKKAAQVAGLILNVLLIAITLVSLLGIIFAPYIVELIVPGFSEQKLVITINLTRIMFLSPILLSVSGIFAGVLTTYRRFFVYSLAPIMYNLGIISGIYLFVPRWGINGLAWAVVLGAFLHMLIQLPGAFACGFRFCFWVSFKDKAIRRITKLMIPRSLSLMVNQFNLLFITIITSTLVAGSLAIFNLANNLAGIPLTIFGAPFAVAVFPDLAFSFNKKKMKRFVQIFSKALTRIAFFVIPTTVIILIMRAQLVRLALGSGKFDWQDTTLTFEVLGFLALSLFFQSLIPLTSRAFFALQNTTIPFISGLVSVLVNIVLAYFLGRSWGVPGVALSFSISQALNLMIMLVILHVKLGGLEDNKIFSTIGKIIIASIFTGVTVQFFKYLCGMSLGTDTFLKIFLQTFVSSVLGGGVFLLVAWYLGIREIKAVKDLIFKLVRNKQLKVK